MTDERAMKVEWICVHGIAGPECERCRNVQAEATRRVPDERAERFGYLLSEIEVGARKLLDNDVEDIMRALTRMQLCLYEATSIAAEVSREALDKVVNDD